MCPDMKTCAAVLHAIAGKDDKDAFTDDIPFDTIPDYEAACKKDALEGARIGQFHLNLCVLKLIRCC